MKRCRHPLVIAHGWQQSEHFPEGHWYEAPYLTKRQADALLCQECNQLLPLGPSNNRPADVKFEIALAEAISDLHVLWEPGRVRTSLVEGAIEWAALTGRVNIRATQIVEHDQ